ncbi:MAG: hypothetical protein V3U02_11355 [Calditrichia bacterium]
MQYEIKKESISWLQKAIDNGYNNRELIKTDKDWKTLNIQFLDLINQQN